jgi:hypothetical protein
MRSFSKKCFTIILSCHKEMDRIKSQDTSQLPFDYSYFVGNDERPINVPEKNITQLSCLDNYESLIFKVYESIKWVDSNIEYDYILKTDDDIVFDKLKINKLYETICSSGIDYTGFFNFSPNTTNREYYSNYHFGKCEDAKINQTSVLCPATDTCASGGAYFLSKKSVKEYLNQFHSQDKGLIFEDLFMGRILNKYKKLNISKDFNQEIREAFLWN